jgi:hypothetical protein
MGHATRILKANLREINHKIDRIECRLDQGSNCDTLKFTNAQKDKLVILRSNLIDIVKTIKFLEDAK